MTLRSAKLGDRIKSLFELPVSSKITLDRLTSLLKIGMLLGVFGVILDSGVTLVATLQCGWLWGEGNLLARGWLRVGPWFFVALVIAENVLAIFLPLTILFLARHWIARGDGTTMRQTVSYITLMLAVFFSVEHVFGAVSWIPALLLGGC